MQWIQIIFVLLQISCIFSLPREEDATTVEAGQIEETTISTPSKLQLNSTTSTTTAKTVEKSQASINSPEVKPAEPKPVELDKNEGNSTSHPPKRRQAGEARLANGEVGKEPSNSLHIEDLGDDLGTWEAPFQIDRNFPYYLAGYDDESRPIWMFEYGKMDLRGLLEKGEEHKEALKKYFRQFAYRLHKNLKEVSTPDNNVTEVMALMDFDELQLRQVAYVPNLDFLLNLALEHRELFINNVAACIIINTNFLAENVVRLVKPVFGPISSKIEVYGTNKQKWIPAVRRIFGPQNLPEWYGGTKDFKPVAVYG